MPASFMVSRLRVPSQNAEYSSVNAPWTYFFSPAAPDRSVVSSKPATGAAAISVRISRTASVTRPAAFPMQEWTNPAERTPPVRSAIRACARSTGTCWNTDRYTAIADRRGPTDSGASGTPAGRAATWTLPQAHPRLVQVVLVPPGRLRFGNVFLLAGPGDAQVSGIRQVSAAPAVPLREVADDLVRPLPAHRRARRPGLLPRLPLPLRPLRGPPLLPARRPAARKVIAARRHRGVPRVPRRGPQGRVQLLPQLDDQGLQRRDPLPVPRDLLILRRDLPGLRFKPRRLLPDQRITRILRRQRIGHATRSSPKPAPATTPTPRPQRNSDL